MRRLARSISALPCGASTAPRLQRHPRQVRKIELRTPPAATANPQRLPVSTAGSSQENGSSPINNSRDSLGLAPSDEPPSSPPQNDYNAPRPKRKLGKHPTIESLDYDIDASTLFESNFSRQPVYERQLDVALKWLVCGVSGMATGALAFVLDFLATNIQRLKFEAASMAFGNFNDAPQDFRAGGYASAILVLILSCILLVSVGSCLVLFVEPISGGSGIPEVKTYLQGLRLPRMLRVSTLFCKSLGVLCSVSGGLVCGKEGPMIHAGAIIAGGFSQGSSKSFKCRTSLLKRFRNDHDKRDFVSAGAAAGVAAAFGAPIGGVLFALEEAATHWSQQLTWRTFFCAIFSTGTLNLLLSAMTDRGAKFGELSHPGLITFGSFLDCQGSDVYTGPELIVFILIGSVCGLLGAAFNTLNRRLTIFRNTHLKKKRSRLFEALTIAALTALASATLPFIIPCTPIPAPGPLPPAPPSPPTPPYEPPPPPSSPGSDAFTTVPPPTRASSLLWAAHPTLAALSDPTYLQSRRSWHAGDTHNEDRCNPALNTMQNFTNQYICGDASLESPLIRLLLTPNEAGIKVLFHGGRLGLNVCLVFFVYSFVFGVITYGIMAPTGEQQRKHSCDISPTLTHSPTSLAYNHRSIRSVHHGRRFHRPLCRRVVGTVLWQIHAWSVCSSWGGGHARRHLPHDDLYHCYRPRIDR